MRTKQYMAQNKIFIDTSFFKAIVDQKDEFHTKALRILKKMQTHSHEMVTTNYILDETFTLIRVKCGLIDAVTFYEGLGSGLINLTLLRVEVDDEILAWKFFKNPWSRLSFTDCTSFALMKRIGLKTVATFDQHFARAGFDIF